MEKKPSLVWNKIGPVGSVTEPTISKAIAAFTPVLVSRKWLLGFEFWLLSDYYLVTHFGGENELGDLL